MNTIRIYWLLLSTFCLFSSYSSAQQPSTYKEEPVGKLKGEEVLIVYLSRTKNTKAVAEIIHKNVGGALVALELENSYPGDYQTTVNQVSYENALATCLH